MHTRFTPSRFIGRSQAITFLIVAGLTLISILFIQQATAQDNRPSLKPPLRLQMDRAAAASVIIAIGRRVVIDDAIVERGIVGSPAGEVSRVAV